MNLKHLEYFTAVAKFGSINKAAQSLYISQPHLSHIIKDIEDGAGSALFHRTKQGVTLTEEGQHFLEHANTILQEMENLRQISKKVRRPADSLSISMTKFSHTMESFIELCRQCQCERESFCYKLNEGSTIDVIGDVESGEADIGVIHFTSGQYENIMSLLGRKELDYIPLTEVKPHIVISAGHELIRSGKSVTLEALRDYGFVRYQDQYEDFVYNITVNDTLLDLGSSSKLVCVYGRSTLMSLIAATDFYTIGIQAFDSQNSMYDVVSVPIEESCETLHFGIISPRGESVTETAQRFIEIVSRRYKSLE